MNDDRIAAPQETEDTQLKTSLRRTRRWIAACSDARLWIAWAAVGIVDGVMRLKLLDGKDLLTDVAILLAAFVGMVSARFIHRGSKKARADMTPVVSSMPRLKITTVFGWLAVLFMAAGLLSGALAGGGPVFTSQNYSAAYLAQTARHLGWLWWSAVAGLVFVVAATVAQPSSLHLGTGSKVCILAVEVCVLLLFFWLGNTLAVAGLMLLHLVVANALLSNDVWQSDELDPLDDKEWGGQHVEHD
jgi:hypothetical protein